eukprot:8151610-Lingulodinium_polyedra.AAC.1
MVVAVTSTLSEQYVEGSSLSHASHASDLPSTQTLRCVYCVDLGYMQLEAPMEGTSARDLLHLSMSGRRTCCYAREHWH